MHTPEHYTIAQVADILGVSKETLRRWDKNGTLIPERQSDNNYRVYSRKQLEQFESAQLLFNSNWQQESEVRPLRPYKLLELFAGAGGLAIGMEQAGFQSVFLNELDTAACSRHLKIAACQTLFLSLQYIRLLRYIWLIY